MFLVHFFLVLSPIEIYYIILYYIILYYIILYYIIYHAVYPLKRQFLYVLLPTMTMIFPLLAISTVALCIPNST